MRRRLAAVWLVFALLLSLCTGCGAPQTAQTPTPTFPPLIPVVSAAPTAQATPAPPLETDPTVPEAPVSEMPEQTEFPVPETPVPTETPVPETADPTPEPTPAPPAPTEEPAPEPSDTLPPEPVPTAEPVPPETPAPARTAEELLETLTLREMVGQLFLVRPEDLDPALADGAPVTEAAAAMLAEYPVGGVILFGNHVQTPEQLSALTASLQAASEVPLFLAVDEEGGLVARLGNCPALGLPQYPDAAEIGATGDPNTALEMGHTIGSYLKAYGFNMDFAPVADVNTNPDNPVIGTRAFSSDPEIAASMSAAMAQGLREAGIIPFFKHFPGHGDTAEDSHSGAAMSAKTAEEMRACEWIPFRTASGGDGIMVGHITTPNLTEDGLPASLSEAVVSGILREELGFSGLVATDALSMGAVANFYDSGTAAVMAFQAGCDILLLPADVPAAFDAILSAVQNGTIPEARLRESVLRILTYKETYGIL